MTDVQIAIEFAHDGRAIQIGRGGYLRPVYVLRTDIEFGHERTRIEATVGWVDTRTAEPLIAQATAFAAAYLGGTRYRLDRGEVVDSQSNDGHGGVIGRVYATEGGYSAVALDGDDTYAGTRGLANVPDAIAWVVKNQPPTPEPTGRPYRFESGIEAPVGMRGRLIETVGCDDDDIAEMMALGDKSCQCCEAAVAPWYDFCQACAAESTDGAVCDHVGFDRWSWQDESGATRTVCADCLNLVVESVEARTALDDSVVVCMICEGEIVGSDAEFGVCAACWDDHAEDTSAGPFAVYSMLVGADDDDFAWERSARYDTFDEAAAVARTVHSEYAGLRRVYVNRCADETSDPYVEPPTPVLDLPPTSTGDPNRPEPVIDPSLEFVICDRCGTVIRTDVVNGERPNCPMLVADTGRYLVQHLVSGRSVPVGTFAATSDALAALDTVSGFRWVWDTVEQRTIRERYGDPIVGPLTAAVEAEISRRAVLV